MDCWNGSPTGLSTIWNKFWTPGVHFGTLKSGAHNPTFSNPPPHKQFDWRKRLLLTISSQKAVNWGLYWEYTGFYPIACFATFRPGVEANFGHVLPKKCVVGNTKKLKGWKNFSCRNFHFEKNRKVKNSFYSNFERVKSGNVKSEIFRSKINASFSLRKFSLCKSEKLLL